MLETPANSNGHSNGSLNGYTASGEDLQALLDQMVERASRPLDQARALPPAAYQEMIATTTLLNKVGADLAKDANVHAITDVTMSNVFGPLPLPQCATPGNR